MINNYKNIVRLKVIGEALKEIKNKVVFVGGAVVDLSQNGSSGTTWETKF